jgi:ribonuclease/clavin/mitogillin
MSRLLVIRSDSSNHYLVGCRDGWLLIDAGWPGRLPDLRSKLRRSDVEIATIAYVAFTHAHPDHAGMTQEVKNAAGAKLLIHESQVPYLQEIQAFFEQRGGYEPIVVGAGDVVVTNGEGRAALRAIGVDGDLIWTPGHSDDSVSLVLDDGAAFTGDLQLPDRVDESSRETVCASWGDLLERGMRVAYPGHAEPVAADRVKQALTRAFAAG